jgi:hypothetical protein
MKVVPYRGVPVPGVPRRAEGNHLQRRRSGRRRHEGNGNPCRANMLSAGRSEIRQGSSDGSSALPEKSDPMPLTAATESGLLVLEGTTECALARDPLSR